MKITTRAILLSMIVSFSIVGLFVWNSSKEPTYGGDFTANYRGQDWTFSQEAKPLNLIYFGYAKCPDVCPLSLSFLGAAFKKLPVDQVSKLRVIFVSVDTKHDIPSDVADYAQNFYPEFIGLSGTEAQIDSTIGHFPASYMFEDNPKSYLGYSISHTDRVFMVNAKGRMIDSISSPRDVESVLAKIKEHL